MGWMDFNEYSLIEGVARDRVDELRHAAESRNGSAGIAATADRDRQLVDALRRRAPEAEERLIATYGDRAYRLAIRITGDAGQAEEVVQEAFLAVVEQIDTFGGSSPAFRSWLYRVVAAAACQKLGDRQCGSADRWLGEALPLFDEHGRHATAIADWTLSLGDPALQTELRRVLSSAITQLPVDYRTAVILRDVEGLSNREICEVLELSPPGVKARVHRARLFLRKRLGEYMARVRGNNRHSPANPDARVSCACG